MVELNLFHYQATHSRLHRMDPRYKMACAAMLSVAAGLAQSGMDCLAMTCFMMVACLSSRLSGRVFLRELRPLLPLLVATLLLRTWGSPGGLWEGALLAWRLCVFLCIGLLLTGTTRLGEIRKAVYWCLRPLPGVPAARIATMFSLTLSLVPLILDQAATVREAQVARCVELVKNPLKRLYYLTWPVLRETLYRADELVWAMESRCYGEQRTRPVFTGGPSDLWIVGSVLILIGILFRVS